MAQSPMPWLSGGAPWHPGEWASSWPTGPSSAGSGLYPSSSYLPIRASHQGLGPLAGTFWLLDISSLLRSREPGPPFQKLRKPVPPPPPHLPRRPGCQCVPPSFLSPSLRASLVPQVRSASALTPQCFGPPGVSPFYLHPDATLPREPHYSLSCELGLCVSISPPVPAPWALGVCVPPIPRPQGSDLPQV